jgi:DNA-binding NarL/FixJ family response regulator
VLIADDHAIVADGLARLVEEVGQVVGLVQDGLQLVARAIELRPDVIVSDISMPGLSGIDAMRQLQTRRCAARFIFLTVHTEPRLAAEALRSGAAGYLIKHSAGEELITAIRVVTDGGSYLTPQITKGVIHGLTSPDSAGRELSPRQRDVLRLIAEGKRMKEIAGELRLSVRTVEDHKRHLMQVLGLETNADLIRFALKQHLISE